MGCTCLSTGSATWDLRRSQGGAALQDCSSPSIVANTALPDSSDVTAYPNVSDRTPQGEAADDVAAVACRQSCCRDGAPCMLGAPRSKTWIIEGKLSRNTGSSTSLGCQSE